MSSYKKIIIDAPIQGDEYERLTSLNGNSLLNHAEEIILVNVFNSKLSNTLPGDIDCKDLDAVKEALTKKLETLRERIDPDNALNWKIDVLFNSEVRNTCVYYAEEVKADLVILSTRGIDLSQMSGSSFSQYMLESCSMDLLILK